MKSKNAAYSYLKSDVALLLYLALGKIAIHFLASGRYGYFRDELYYMACGEKLAFGYVDHPPFVAIIAKISRLILGDSLFALRFFPALAGALVVFLTGMIVRELGGKRFAQFLAALAVIISPIYLGLGSFLSMNPFDHLFWALSAYILVLILKSDNTKLWILLGIILGLGLQNKYSMIFFGFGLVVGFLLTTNRKYFLNPQLWIAGFIAFFIFLPNLIWQIINKWQTLEFMKNASLYKNLPLAPLEFLSSQILEMHPFLFPILLFGLFYYLFSKSGKPFRLFGWMYLAIFILFIMSKAKTYYIAPIYPVMFAAGSVAIEKFMLNKRRNWLKPVTATVLILGGVLTAPMALPLLPVETYISYSEFLGVAPPPAERHEMGRLPQHFADMFGWENMVATVAKAYHQLSLEEKAKCGIFCGNYGEAGAIDFFGQKFDLPKAISGHNNYWLWGPRGYRGEVMLIIGVGEHHLKSIFKEVMQVAVIKHEYVMPYENNLPIYLCKDALLSMEEVWPKLKNYN
ncbi:MAG: glycosyltransferase family 39 protein [Candidatus Aminicenantes bacterium]|nr:MAG: glycosyltransferase family 39 protein [Candidatus Aminicenantes bacterium]